MATLQIPVTAADHAQGEHRQKVLILEIGRRGGGERGGPCAWAEPAAIIRTTRMV